MRERGLTNPADPLSVRSILVYVTSDADNALGENVLKLPLLLALATAFPVARISWVPGTSGAFYLRDQLAPLVDGRIGEFIADLAIPADAIPGAPMPFPSWIDTSGDRARFFVEVGPQTIVTLEGEPHQSSGSPRP